MGSMLFPMTSWKERSITLLVSLMKMMGFFEEKEESTISWK